MQISKITVNQTFKSNSTTTNKHQSNPQIKSFLDKIHENTKNSSDMTDTIIVPRTIFKGYLGIMAGTTLATIGSLITSRFPKTGKTLSVSGLLASLYGTYAFVRPFIIKDAPGVEHSKQA